MLILGFLAACSVEESDQPVTLLDTYLQDPVALERGRLLFEGSCASYCHGTAPQDGEDVDLFDCQWKYGGTNDDIFRIVTTGIPETRMVGFGNNFPEGQNDLWMLIAYLRNEQQVCDQI
ncbi:MAG: c-type cytochrome [Pseudomonadales bacterium]|nr:c-type cytochrome [Pseudomonadales bacterium]